MRRLYLATVVALIAVACRNPPPDRGVVLGQVVRTVVRQSYERLTTTAQALTAAANALERDPTNVNLQIARAEWRNAIASLAYTYAFRLGPIVEQRLNLREAYWPIRTAAVEALLAKGADPDAVNSAGAAAKGLFAMEYLLFDQDGTAAGARWRLLRLLSAQYESACGAIAEAAHRDEFVARTAARGQEGIAIVVNDIVEAVEVACVELAQPTAAPTETPRRSMIIAGTRSGSVPAIARARLEGAREHYLQPEGFGIAALVAATAPSIDQDVRNALGVASASVDACRKLEVSMKAGLPAALGITLTARSLDGD